MPKDISRAKFVVTGHNREAKDRVLHYVRAQTTDGQPVMPTGMQPGQIYTDDAGILADGTVVEIAVTYDVVGA
jgi:hypothetical protein